MCTSHSGPFYVSNPHEYGLLEDRYVRNNDVEFV